MSKRSSLEGISNEQLVNVLDTVRELLSSDKKYLESLLEGNEPGSKNITSPGKASKPGLLSKSYERIGTVSDVVKLLQNARMQLTSEQEEYADQYEFLRQIQAEAQDLLQKSGYPRNYYNHMGEVWDDFQAWLNDTGQSSLDYDIKNVPSDIINRAKKLIPLPYTSEDTQYPWHLYELYRRRLLCRSQKKSSNNCENRDRLFGEIFTEIYPWDVKQLDKLQYAVEVVCLCSMIRYKLKSNEIDIALMKASLELVKIYSLMIILVNERDIIVGKSNPGPRPKSDQMVNLEEENNRLIREFAAKLWKEENVRRSVVFIHKKISDNLKEIQKSYPSFRLPGVRKFNDIVRSVNPNSHKNTQ